MRIPLVVLTGGLVFVVCSCISFLVLGWTLGTYFGAKGEKDVHGLFLVTMEQYIKKQSADGRSDSEILDHLKHILGQWIDNNNIDRSGFTYIGVSPTPPPANQQQDAHEETP